MQSKIILLVVVIISLSSCVSKKRFNTLKSELEMTNIEMDKLTNQLARVTKDYEDCKRKGEMIKNDKNELLKLRMDQIKDLKAQIRDLKKYRDKQMEQVGDLTVLSQSANENIKKTLQQLEGKDKYIRILQAARTKADSINLALAVNLKSVLKEGIADNDIDVNVDKTVVFINLSDKMLYQSGSSLITPRAEEVLGKIAKIIKSKPNLEVMVEGYTDNMPITNSCIRDNWDLSVKRATSVVRVLQQKYGIDPNRLIAAGRGEYNALADNNTPEGRAINRRTRIIILPKLDEFYDLLNPKNIPE